MTHGKWKNLRSKRQGLAKVDTYAGPMSNKPTVISDKKLNSRDKRNSEASAQARVGIPAKPMLGKRTLTAKGRDRLRIQVVVSNLLDPASGRLFVGRNFNTSTALSALMLIARYFINPCYDFFTVKQLMILFNHFLNKFNFNDRSPLSDIKRRCKQIRSDFNLMKECVDLYGPAFIPNGIVINNGIQHLHRIKIKDGSLLAAQENFLRRQLNWLSPNLPMVGAGRKRKTKLENQPKSGEQTKAQVDKNGSTNLQLKLLDIPVPNANVKNLLAAGKQDVRPILDKGSYTKEKFTYKPKIVGNAKHQYNDLQEDSYLDALQIVDLGGAPFCGRVCVDVVSGNQPNFDEYIKFCENQGFKDVFEAGDNHLIDQYAKSRGLNLMIIKNTTDLIDSVVQGFRETPNGRSVVHVSQNTDNGNWIVLFHSGKTRRDENIPIDGDEIPVGHYEVMIQAAAPIKVTPLPRPDFKRSPYLFYNWEHTIVEVSREVGLPGTDNRQINHQRENVEINDTYATMSESWILSINRRIIYFLLFMAFISYIPLRIKNNFSWDVTQGWIHNVWAFLFYFDNSPFRSVSRCYAPYFLTELKRLCFVPFTLVGVRNFSPYVCPVDYENEIKLALFLVITALFYLDSICDITLTSPIQFHFNSPDEFMVSVSLCNSSWPTLQTMSRFEDFDWGNLQRMKNIDTNATIPGIFRNTKYYMSYVWKSLKKDVTYSSLAGRALTAMNSYNAGCVYISRPNLAKITKNQQIGLLNGAGRNYVKRIKKIKDDSRHNIPIAVAPIGAPKTNNGFVGPGMLPVTDTIGVLAAFCGRSMAKDFDLIDMNLVNEFIQFSKRFLDYYIEGTDCTDIVEEDNIEFFSRHYHGKRSRAWIDGMISQYRHYVDGLESRNFDSHSCFVKLENSAKEVDGKWTSKPRLIMTMSPVMLFESVQIHKVIERWNKGPFQIFQVKEMSREDMVEKIQLFCANPHEVTDYSSFECSIIEEIREIENYVLFRLLDKAGLSQTKASFSQYVAGPRELRYEGLILHIESRCSGDPHTSCGNGIINACLAAFSAYKNNKLSSVYGPHPEFCIVEGDDGIVPKGNGDPDLLRKLGFEYSSSVCGLYPGDTDFLRRRWVDNKVYLNIGRAFNVFWVKNKAKLSENKLKFLLRCMGCSLHHMSPGHPVLFAIVNRIGMLTSGITAFKNWFLHIDLYKWTGIDIDNYPHNVQVDSSMRAEIARGAEGFPPIPIDTQLYLESQIMCHPEMYIGESLNNYPEIRCYVDSLTDYEAYPQVFSSSVLELIAALGFGHPFK